MNGMLRMLVLRLVAALAVVVSLSWGAAAQAPQGAPIKVGFSMSLTGGTAPNGKQLLLSLESGATT